MSSCLERTAGNRSPRLSLMGEAWPGKPPLSLIPAPCLRAGTGQEWAGTSPSSHRASPSASSPPSNMPDPLPSTDSRAVPFVLAPVNCGTHSFASFRSLLKHLLLSKALPDHPVYNSSPSPPHTPHSSHCWIFPHRHSPPLDTLVYSAATCPPHKGKTSTRRWGLLPVWFPAVSPVSRTVPGTQ